MPAQSSRHLLALAALALAAGCASAPAKAPHSVRFDTNPLDRHVIGVEAATEVLEIAIDPAYPTLKRADLRAIERFVAAYRDRGHGPLVMAMPENGPYQALAVEAVRVARELAWQKGVSWEQIDGRAFDADGGNAPVMLSFEVYETIAPECRSLAAYDLSDISSNNEQGYFGCAVTQNIAQMIADPGDLLSRRSLDPRDPRRVSVIMEAYRNGLQTGAQGGDEEVSVSEVAGGGGGN